MHISHLVSLLPLLALTSGLTIKDRSPLPAPPSPASDYTKLSNAARLARGLPLRKPRSYHNPSTPHLLARQSTPSGAPSNARTVCSNYQPSQFGQSCTAAAQPGGVGGTCCTDSPGGLLLLTQFWDAGANSVGPATSWTAHGLWPDNCDSTYEEYCDPSRERTNIRQILNDNGQQSLVGYMDTYWKSNSGTDESFWAHEWNKHGTCISSLDTACFLNPTPNGELVVYFQKAVSTFQTLPSYDWLAADGIVPSVNTTYTNAQIVASLSKRYGFTPVIRCASGAIDEIWYFYNSVGGVVDGSLVKTNSVGSSNNCPATGIRYLPKYTTIPSPPATAPGVTGKPPSTVGQKGFVYPVYPDGTQETGTCLISVGAWYKGGTCAGYTTAAPPSGSPSGTFFLKTTKGLCAISPTTKALSCAASITDATAAVWSFTADGEMSVGGDEAFGSPSRPSGSNQIVVYSGAGQVVDYGLTFVLQ